jgi:quercetin dioxygenase-like cupin family protein
MQRRLERPFRPIEVDADTLEFFHLTSLGDDLKRDAEYEDSGVCSISIARDEDITLVLTALRAGASMREHHMPSAGTLVLLTGRVAFEAEGGAEREELTPGAMAVFSSDLFHGVVAREDSTLLVIIGGRARPETSHGESGREAVPR